MSYRDYEKETLLPVLENIKEQGFRVFLAERGTYGFFTDSAGSRVISFQVDLGHVTASGNYITSNPRNTGTGWRMSDNITGNEAKDLFSCSPPQWATKGASKVRLTTLDEHLATYQPSSKYKEL